jgi:hypothetical protein
LGIAVNAEDDLMARQGHRLHQHALDMRAGRMAHRCGQHAIIGRADLVGCEVEGDRARFSLVRDGGRLHLQGNRSAKGACRGFRLFA